MPFIKLRGVDIMEKRIYSKNSENLVRVLVEIDEDIRIAYYAAMEVPEDLWANAHHSDPKLKFQHAMSHRRGNHNNHINNAKHEILGVHRI